MSRFFKIFLIKGKYFEVFIWEDIKKTSQDVYETIKGKTENIFELLKAYFYETTVLFFKENSLDTESNMTVVELEKLHIILKIIALANVKLHFGISKNAWQNDIVVL